MSNVTTAEWRLLLRLILAQRLEINAIESALKRAKALTDAEIREIRTQALETAKAWSSDDGDDILTLIRVHSSPDATMLIPPAREQ
jgi:predicted oxidoreductase